MNFLQRIFSKSKPHAAPRRYRGPGASNTPIITSNVASRYDALKPSDTREQFTATAYDYENHVKTVNELDRITLYALGEHLYENNGVVSNVVDTFANYTAPVVPQFITEAFNAKWESWCAVADFTRKYHFYTIQGLISKAINIGGSTGVIVTTKDGFPQVQLIEGWRINSRNADRALGFIDGIKKDEFGRIMAYMIDSKTIVPEPEMLLLYRPGKWSDDHGVSPLRRGANDIRDREDIKGFEKMAAKIFASMPAVIIGGKAITSTVWNDPTIGETESTTKLKLSELLGGQIPALELGQDIKQLSGDRPSVNIQEFMTALAANFIYGCGLPPAFILDSKLTGPNIRSVLNKAQHEFDNQIRVQITALTWIATRVMAWFISKGELEAVKGWENMTFQAPPRLSIDVQGQEQVDRDKVRQGLMSQRRYFGDRSQNWLKEHRQIIQEDRITIEDCIATADQFANKLNRDDLLSALLAKRGLTPNAWPSTQTQIVNEPANP